MRQTTQAQLRVLKEAEDGDERLALPMPFPSIPTGIFK